MFLLNFHKTKRYRVLFHGKIKAAPSYSDRLKIYCDEFSEFNLRCEQLCRAFDHIATHHDSISSFSVRGMKQNALWLKWRMQEMEQKLTRLYEETCQTNSNHI
ncbi:hypothetical protein A3195_19825 [Candidatus Thiodiazotropha endoloripes]|nr:hypothetical protein A3193_19510 [Candidatus Thiodiazotropha endoloripes]ODB82522.1 hypothetical protein A3195_19825 [Candidatus Thiodiazotropha endoloripes]ODB94598.1 hypothetical protein A3194_20320 [Candidatus Thiodiazotropha endoloripes]